MYTVNYTPTRRVTAPPLAAPLGAKANPQPNGLSRAELRRLVEEMLG